MQRVRHVALAPSRMTKLAIAGRAGPGFKRNRQREVSDVEDDHMTAPATRHPNYIEAARLDRVAFWSPLPAAGNLSSAAQALVRESDADIRKQRFESALDASFTLNALEPTYLPGYIRSVELLVATLRRDHARTLLDTIIHREQVLDHNDFELELSRLKTHIEPDPDQAYQLAQRLIGDEHDTHLVPYVPAAIELLAEADRLDESVQLAESWVEREPASALALSYLVRTHLKTGDGQAALKTIRNFRDQFDADKIWPENLVVSALASTASDDIEPKWMAAGPVCQALREGKLDYQHVTGLLEFLIPAISSSQRGLLFAGLLATNAGDFQEAQALFQTTPAESPVENYLRNTGLERAAFATNDPRARISALQEIWRILEDSQVASIAESSEIFDPPANRTTVGLAIARLLQQDQAPSDALAYLDSLIKAGNQDAEVLRLQAELMGQSGARNDALTTLEALAKRQEESHEYANAIETLESMIRLAPGNIRLRAQVVENCLKIGKFEQAIDQLVMQGRLFHKAGRLTDAERPIHRAIEIATMTSDWDKVSKLHRLLISFSPDETRLRHSAVATYVQYGRTSEAMSQLREIVRIARKHNDLDEAIAASHQMLALDPNDPATYHQLGELLVSIQEYNQADRVYRRLSALAPDDHAVKAKRSAIAALTRARQQSNNR